MNTDTLEPLVAQLCRGDLTAARQVFLACEPQLRKLVRRQLSPRLRPKFDSADVVQSVWADLLAGFRRGDWEFQDVHSFRAFLVQVTRNRFHDKFRKHRIAYEREQGLGGVPTSKLPNAPQPNGPEVLAAQELWERMQALCPPEHQEVLMLKKQGVPMEDIVRRTGLHPGSIRRVLRNLARKLALGETECP